MATLYKKYKPYIVISLISLISTFILWLPFLAKSQSIYGIPTPNISFETVIKHWDGPLYIIPAKTLYDKDHDILQKSPMGLSDKYFSAHLPLYPATISTLAPFLGYRKAMLASTLIGAVLLFSAFYFILKKLKLTHAPLTLTLVFMFFTPRFFVTRSVGSPEPMFLLLILGSLYYFAQKRYFWAGILGALSILTKTPGGLLFFAYALYFVHEYLSKRKFNLSWGWIFLIPGAFLALSGFYYLQLGDFFAYFNSGDNLHLLIPPFQVFNHQARWVATGWLEEIIFIYYFYGFMLLHLFPFSGIHLKGATTSMLNKIKTFLSTLSNAIEEKTHKHEYAFKRISFYFGLLFFLSLISVQHRDIARYSLPLLPLGLITFERFFTSRKFLVLSLFLLPAIYVYAWNFMLVNIAPINDWVPFM